MLQLDNINKRIIPHDYLTLVFSAMYDDDTKMMFGRPSDMLIYEDIILNFSLKQL
jgi:hypothetical protein